MRALVRFGAPLFGLTTDDLAKKDTVLQIGVAPQRIDLLTGIGGVEFDEAWDGRAIATMEGISYPVIGRVELLKNKRAVGRPQDVADATRLEAIPPRHEPPRRAST